VGICSDRNRRYTLNSTSKEQRRLMRLLMEMLS
jgi:hypothetical protein